LVPFLMDHIALQPELMQGDDIHPNLKGQPILLDNVWPVLQPMLKK
jgi:acyl-CoA thioesterase I